MAVNKLTGKPFVAPPMTLGGWNSPNSVVQPTGSVQLNTPITPLIPEWAESAKRNFGEGTWISPTNYKTKDGSVIALEPPMEWFKQQQNNNSVVLPESVTNNLPTPVVTPNTPLTATANGTENRSTTITPPEPTFNGRSSQTYTPPQSQITMPDMTAWNQTSQRKKRGNLFSDVWGANSPIHTGSMYSNRGGFYNPV